jgi:MoxR-like ATPase
MVQRNEMTELFKSPEEVKAAVERLHSDKNAMMDEIARVIVGQEEVVELLLASIFAGGHALLIGVPGLAKTALVRALASALDLSFKRIQFTPDLMPSDITGTNVIVENEEGRRRFEFVQGPVFANIVLADEVNRSPAKTQAALLEAMQERQVTVGRDTYKLPYPFFVIATQNPIEQEGTYELPEAQLDRFLLSIHVGYPSVPEEEQIISSPPMNLDIVKKVMGVARVVEIHRLTQAVRASNYVVSYVTRLVRSTRPNDKQSPDFVKEMVEWGVGPRAGQFLLWMAKALAAMNGRLAAGAADVRRALVPVLRHRLSLNFQGQAKGVTAEDVLNRLLEVTPEPKE